LPKTSPQPRKRPAKTQAQRQDEYRARHGITSGNLTRRAAETLKLLHKHTERSYAALQEQALDDLAAKLLVPAFLAGSMANASPTPQRHDDVGTSGSASLAAKWLRKARPAYPNAPEASPPPPPAESNQESEQVLTNRPAKSSKAPAKQTRRAPAQRQPQSPPASPSPSATPAADAKILSQLAFDL